MENSFVDYDEKFKEMQSYLPLLEGIINRIETTSCVKNESILKGIHLPKIKSLKSLLRENTKRMKVENLLRCELVLKKLKDKFEKSIHEKNAAEIKTNISSSSQCEIDKSSRSGDTLNTLNEKSIDLFEKTPLTNILNKETIVSSDKINSNVKIGSKIMNSSYDGVIDSLSARSTNDSIIEAPNILDNKTSNTLIFDTPNISDNITVNVEKKSFNFYQELTECQIPKNGDKYDDLQISPIKSESDLQTCREKLKEFTKLKESVSTEKVKCFEKEIQIVTKAYIDSENAPETFTKLLSESLNNITMKNKETVSNESCNSSVEKKDFCHIKKDLLKCSSKSDKINRSSDPKPNPLKIIDTEKEKSNLNTCPKKNLSEKIKELNSKSKDRKSYHDSHNYHKESRKYKSSSPDRRHRKTDIKRHNIGNDHRRSKSRSKSRDLYSSYFDKHKTKTDKKNENKKGSGSNLILKDENNLDELIKLREQITKQLELENKIDQIWDVAKESQDESIICDKEVDNDITLLYDNFSDPNLTKCTIDASEKEIPDSRMKFINTKSSLNSNQLVSIDSQNLSDAKIVINLNKKDNSKTVIPNQNIEQMSPTTSIDSVSNTFNVTKNKCDDTSYSLSTEKKGNNIGMDLKKTITDNFTKKYLEDANKLGELTIVKQTLDIQSDCVDILQNVIFDAQDENKIDKEFDTKTHTEKNNHTDLDIHSIFQQEVLNALNQEISVFPNPFESVSNKEYKSSNKDNVKPLLKESILDNHTNKQTEPKTRRISLEKYKEKMNLKVSQVECEKKIESKYKNSVEIINRVLTPKEIERFNSVIESTVEESLNDSEIIREEKLLLISNDNEGSESSEFLGPESPDSNSSFQYTIDRSPNVNEIPEIEDIQEMSMDHDVNTKTATNSGDMRPWLMNSPQSCFGISPLMINPLPNTDIQNKNMLLFVNTQDIPIANDDITENYKCNDNGRDTKMCKRSKHNPIEDPRKSFYPPLTNRFNVDFPVSANYKGKNPKPILGINRFSYSNLDTLTNETEKLSKSFQRSKNDDKTNSDSDRIQKKSSKKSSLDSSLNKKASTESTSKKPSLLPTPPFSQKVLLSDPISRNTIHISTDSALTEKTTNSTKSIHKSTISSNDPRLKKYDVNNKKDDISEKVNIFSNSPNNLSSPNVSHNATSKITVAPNDPRIKMMNKEIDTTIKFDCSIEDNDKNHSKKDSKDIKNEEIDKNKQETDNPAQKCKSFKIPKMKWDDNPKEIIEENSTKLEKNDDECKKAKKMNKDVVIIDVTDTYVVYDEMITYDSSNETKNKHDHKNKKKSKNDCVKNENTSDQKNLACTEKTSENALEMESSISSVINLDSESNEKHDSECKVEYENHVNELEEKFESSIMNINEVNTTYILKNETKTTLEEIPKDVPKNHEQVDNVFISSNIELSQNVDTLYKNDNEKVQNPIKIYQNTDSICEKHENITKSEENSNQQPEKNSENTIIDENNVFFANLFSVLKDKKKMNEMLNLLAHRRKVESIPQKFIKTFEMLAEIDSDDETDKNESKISNNSENQGKKSDDTLQENCTDKSQNLNENTEENSENSNENTEESPENEAENSKENTEESPENEAENSKENTEESPENEAENSLKKNPKPKRKAKAKSEIAMLHDALPEVYRNEGGICTIGVRMCRLKEIDKETSDSKRTRQKTNIEKPTLKPSSPNPKTIHRKKSPENNIFKEPVIILEKTTVTQSTDIDSSLDTDTRSSIQNVPISSVTNDNLIKSFENANKKSKPCPKSKKKYYSGESLKSSEKNLKKNDAESSNDEDTALINISSIIKKKSKFKQRKKRRRARWSLGNLEKKSIKVSVEKNQSLVKNKCPLTGRFLKTNKSKSPNLCDLSYHFHNKTVRYTCKYCDYNSDRYIVKHYKQKHPDSEVLISRLSKKDAKIAIDEACGIEINNPIMTKLKFKYRCRFCHKYSLTFFKFYKHVTLYHTGEYNEKDISTINNINSKNQFCSILNGYICHLCNFTQVNEDNTKIHVANRHSNEECKITKINLSSINFAEESPTENEEVGDKANLEIHSAQSSTDEDIDIDVNFDNGINTNAENISFKGTNMTFTQQLSNDNIGDGVFSLSGNVSMLSNEYNSFDISNINSIGEFKIKEELIEPEIDLHSDENLPSDLISVKKEPDCVDSEDRNYFESLHDTLETCESEDKEKIISIGDLKAKFISNVKIEFTCVINGCYFTKTSFLTFSDHVSSTHVYDIWNGFCELCNKSYEASGYDAALHHLMIQHVNPNRKTFSLNPSTKVPTMTKLIKVRPLKQLQSDHNDKDSSKEIVFPPLRIENVMSLNPEVLQQSNISDKMVCNVTDTLKKKDERNLKKIESETFYHGIKIGHSSKGLYQCAENTCEMATNNRYIFLGHFSNHSSHESFMFNPISDPWMSCVYCKEEFTLTTSLVDHITKFHSSSYFVCETCNFRSTSYILTLQHSLKTHSNIPYSNRVKYSPLTEIDRTQYRPSRILPKEKCVPSFICTYKNGNEECGKTFYSSEMYLTHIDAANHNVPMCCQYCRAEGMEPFKILWHLRHAHNYNLYRCAYCIFGTDVPIDIINHMIHSHCHEDPVYFLCKSLKGIVEESSTLSPLDAVEVVDLSKNVKSHLENIFDLTVETDGIIDKCEKKRGKYISELLATYSTDDDVKTPDFLKTKTHSSNSNTIFEHKKNSKYSEVQPNSSSFYNYSTNNASSPKPQNTITDCNRLLKELAVKNLVLNNEKEKMFTDSNWLPESEETSTGKTSTLSGKQLFRCGNDGCDYSSEIPTINMRNHLKKCNKGNPNIFICYHCRNTYAQPGHLLGHLPVHGKPRYKCTLCNEMFSVRVLGMNHMKKKHLIQSAVIVALNPNKVNHYIDDFILVDQNNSDINTGTKRKSDDFANKKYKKIKIHEDSCKLNKFKPKDIDNLPHERILNEMIYCDECSYSTKVTSNMLRHLKQHLSESFVPTVAPVNPVPHLHSNGMHFDKMTNLALSSNIDRIPIRRNSSLTNMAYPAFVPTQNRFVCGSEMCKYQTVNEKMLQNHWNTLHIDEYVFHCHHCLENITVEENKNDKIWSHLRMHGDTLYNCNKCKFFHYSKHIMKQHGVECHSDDSCFNALRIALSDTNVDSWKCKICNVIQTDKASIMKHCRNVHGGIFKCNFCSQMKSSKSFLDFHYKKMHPDTPVGDKRFMFIFEKCNQSNTPKEFVFVGDITPKRKFTIEDDGPLRSPTKVSRSLLKSQNLETKINSDCVKLPNYSYGKSVSGKFSCTICKAFTTEDELSFQTHLFEELNYRTWYCTLCSYKSFDEVKIKAHSLDEHHTSIVPNRSNMVHNVEIWVKDCIEHQKNDMKQTIKDANICEESSSKNDSNDNNCNDENDDYDENRLVICTEEEIPEKKVNSPKKVTIEPKFKRKGTNNKVPPKHRCKYCFYETLYKKSLKLHEMRHWKIKPFGCKYCDKQFVQKKELSLHFNRSHHQYEFEVVHNILPATPSIVNFKRMKHNMKPPETSKNKSFEIETSFKVIDFTNEIGNDIDVLGKNFSKVNESNLTSNQTPKLTCPSCSSEFPDSEKLSLHYQLSHQNEEWKHAFLCIYCPVRFENYNLLMNHYRLFHKNSTIGVIPLISAQIQDTGEIKGKFSIRKGFYECIVTGCDLTSNNIEDFKTHVRSHYYIYKCALCYESFQVGSQYGEHRRTKHKDIDSFPKSLVNRQQVVLDRIFYIDSLINQLVDSHIQSDLNDSNKSSESIEHNPKAKIKQTARKSTASICPSFTKKVKQTIVEKELHEKNSTEFQNEDDEVLIIDY